MKTTNLIVNLTSKIKEVDPVNELAENIELANKILGISELESDPVLSLPKLFCPRCHSENVAGTDSEPLAYGGKYSDNPDFMEYEIYFDCECLNCGYEFKHTFAIVPQQIDSIFKPSGYIPISNVGGIEVMIEESEERVYYRFTAGDTKIEFAEIQSDQEGEHYFLQGSEAIYLKDIQRT